MLLLAAVAPEAAPDCLISKTFGVSCWGCGLTRAFSAAVQGDWQKAISLNRLIVLWFPLAIAAALAAPVTRAAELLRDRVAPP